MNYLKKSLLIAFALIIMIVIWGCNVIWRSPKYYSLETRCSAVENVWTMKDYLQVINTHARPYTFVVNSIQNGAALIYGSTHTKNPDNEQIQDIDQRWQEFNPSVALVEGRLGFLIPGFMNPVAQLGEMGKVGELARKDKIPIYSWDVSKEELAKSATRKFNTEQIALSLILNPYFGNLRFGKPKSPEKFVKSSLDRASMVGLENEIKTVDDIDNLWQRYFPNGPDWRDTSDQYGLPGFLQNIADEFNLIRNERLTCNILDLVQKGERVFVIGGSSHAVCIEEALKIAISQ